MMLGDMKLINREMNDDFHPKHTFQITLDMEAVIDFHALNGRAALEKLLGQMLVSKLEFLTAD